MDKICKVCGVRVFGKKCAKCSTLYEEQITTEHKCCGGTSIDCCVEHECCDGQGEDCCTPVNDELIEDEFVADEDFFEEE